MIVPLVRVCRGRAEARFAREIYWRAFVADCRKFRDGAMMIAQRLRDKADYSNMSPAKCRQPADDVSASRVIPRAPALGHANVAAALLLIRARVWL